MDFFLLTIFILCFMLFILFSCEEEQKDFKEIEYYQLTNKYFIYFNKFCQGTVSFNNQGTFVMNTIKGNVFYGNYSISPINKKQIAITWAEDANGNILLTEEDYINGYYVDFNFIDKTILYINNLPYYRNETIMLIRNEQ